MLDDINKWVDVGQQRERDPGRVAPGMESDESDLDEAEGEEEREDEGMEQARGGGGGGGKGIVRLEVKAREERGRAGKVNATINRTGRGGCWKLMWWPEVVGRAARVGSGRRD